jgi:hypothetical protein
MSNTIPKFQKVSIILKSIDIKSTLDKGLSRDKRTFENCGLMITGGYLIITSEKSDGTVGSVFALKDILEYKTYNK